MLSGDYTIFYCTSVQRHVGLRPLIAPHGNRNESFQTNMHLRINLSKPGYKILPCHQRAAFLWDTICPVLLMVLWKPFSCTTDVTFSLVSRVCCWWAYTQYQWSMAFWLVGTTVTQGWRPEFVKPFIRKFQPWAWRLHNVSYIAAFAICKSHCFKFAILV